MASFTMSPSFLLIHSPSSPGHQPSHRIPNRVGQFFGRRLVLVRHQICGTELLFFFPCTSVFPPPPPFFLVSPFFFRSMPPVPVAQRGRYKALCTNPKSKLVVLIVATHFVPKTTSTISLPCAAHSLRVCPAFFLRQPPPLLSATTETVWPFHIYLPTLHTACLQHFESHLASVLARGFERHQNSFYGGFPVSFPSLIPSFLHVASGNCPLNRG